MTNLMAPHQDREHVIITWLVCPLWIALGDIRSKMP